MEKIMSLEKLSKWLDEVEYSDDDWHKGYAAARNHVRILLESEDAKKQRPSYDHLEAKMPYGWWLLSFHTTPHSPSEECYTNCVELSNRKPLSFTPLADGGDTFIARGMGATLEQAFSVAVAQTHKLEVERS
jgi:hypothetical protein